MIIKYSLKYRAIESEYNTDQNQLQFINHVIQNPKTIGGLFNCIQINSDNEIDLKDIVKFCNILDEIKNIIDKENQYQFEVKKYAKDKPNRFFIFSDADITKNVDIIYILELGKQISLSLESNPIICYNRITLEQLQKIKDIKNLNKMTIIESKTLLYFDVNTELKQ